MLAVTGEDQGGCRTPRLALLCIPCILFLGPRLCSQTRICVHVGLVFFGGEEHSSGFSVLLDFNVVLVYVGVAL